jgi:multiple sugar transport system permease protein
MAAVAERPPLSRRLRRWEGLPYWLTLPAVAYLGLFFAWPMIQAFQLAFEDPAGGWSLAPFRGMVDDLDFGRAFRFTLLFVVVIIPVQFALALAMALLVNAKLKGAGIFLFIFVIPLTVSDLTAGLVWSTIFTELGYLNTVLEGLGVIDRPYFWIDSLRPNLLLGEVVVAELWRSTAIVVVILVAGLQGIPKEYTEAAEVFGAGFLQRLRRVILPMLKPSLQAALLLRIIFALEMFAAVIAITGRSATTLSAQTYQWQQTYHDENIAAAYASLILLLSLVGAGLVLGLVRVRMEQLA